MKMKKEEMLRKVIDEDYTTSDRVARALAIIDDQEVNEISSGENEKRFSIKRREDKRRTVNPTVSTEGFVCTCEDYLNRKIMCKHVIAAYLKAKDMFEGYLKGEAEKTTIQAVLESGVDNLDSLTGGIPIGSPLGIYGQPNVGKSFLCYQIASLASNKFEEPSFYLDTEGFFNKKIQDKFGGYYDRYDGKIDFSVQKDLKRVGELLGLDIELTGDKRIDAMINYADEIPIEKSIKMFNYRVFVVDSLTSPVKKKIPIPPTQNLPARASIFSSIVGILNYLAEKYNMLTVITFHRSRNPTSPWEGSRPYGGSNILYNTKYLLNLRYPTKDEREDFKKQGELRKIEIDRWAGEKPDWTILRLAEDYGYTDP